MLLYNWNKTSCELSDNWPHLPNEFSMVNPDGYAPEPERQSNRTTTSSPGPGENSSGPNAKDPKSPGKPTAGMTLLRPDFVPGERDIICARGKTAKNHPGNVWYRNLCMEHIQEYSECESKLDKSFLVSKIIKIVRKASPGGGFIKNINGQWYEVGGRLSREKIGQTFRDMLHTQYRSSTKAKARKRASADSCSEAGDSETSPISPNKLVSDGLSPSKNDFRDKDGRPSKARKLDTQVESKVESTGSGPLPASFGSANNSVALTGSVDTNRSVGASVGTNCNYDTGIYTFMVNHSGTRNFPSLPTLQNLSASSSFNAPGIFHDHHVWQQQQLQQQYQLQQLINQQPMHLGQGYQQHQQLETSNDPLLTGTIVAPVLGRHTSLGPLPFNENLGQERRPSSGLCPAAVREMLHGQLLESELTLESNSSESNQDDHNHPNL